MRALVTGGCGFIGSHLVAALTHSGHEVCVLDDLSTGRRENIAGSPARLIEASIDEPSALRDALAEVDTLFHLAAMVSVPVSIRRPAACLRINVTATAALLEEAVASGVSTVVFASSAAVYGSEDRGAQTEDQPLRPGNPYGVSKVTGEDLCRLLDNSGQVRAVSLRFFNIYGPRQDPQGSYGSVVPEFARRALAGDSL
ncbi:MAG: NAD-dependent epimerase/dehydratase family protein, partial [Myxococcota bacterium]|nr:NAD-dependent epimerase/dehydratase family protein [Myxococcota bacterium]